MDFEETAEEAAFRAEARAWLDSRAARRKAGEQSDHSYMPGDGDPDADDKHVAAAVRYLAGPESTWVTGQMLGIDGGHQLRCGPDFGSVLGG